MSEVIKKVLNEYGDIVYEERDDGYWEENIYTDDGKLIQSTSHYANGIVEVENYKV